MFSNIHFGIWEIEIWSHPNKPRHTCEACIPITRRWSRAPDTCSCKKKKKKKKEFKHVRGSQVCHVSRFQVIEKIILFQKIWTANEQDSAHGYDTITFHESCFYSCNLLVTIYLPGNSSPKDTSLGKKKSKGSTGACIGCVLGGRDWNRRSTRTN